MKLEDVKICQLLKSEKFDVVVKVIRVDPEDQNFPVKVKFVSGDKRVLTSGNAESSFSNNTERWIHASHLTPGQDYLTLEALELLEAVTPKFHMFKIGDILVHPESGIRLEVVAIDGSDIITPVQVRVITKCDSRNYYIGNIFGHKLKMNAAFWIFDSKEDVEDDRSPESIITLEDLILENECRGKRPTIEEVREITAKAENVKGIVLDLDDIYSEILIQAKQSRHIATVIKTANKAEILQYLKQEGYRATELDHTLKIEW